MMFICTCNMERLWNYVLDLQKLPRGCVVKELNMAPVLVI